MQRKAASTRGGKKMNDAGVSDNKGKTFTKAQGKGKDSPMRKLIKADEEATRLLAVCATSKSRWGHLRPLMVLLELSCHGVVWLLGCFAAILLSHQAWVHEVLLNLFAVLCFDLIVVGLIKVIVRRNRPSHNSNDMMGGFPGVDAFSFPSGHTTRAFMVGCFFLTNFQLEASIINGLTIWVLAIAVSRVMMGRHHISDVVLGSVIGFLEYQVFVRYLWLSSELCEKLIRPIQEEIHL